VKVGDLVVFSLPSSMKEFDHIGIVVDYEPITTDISIKWDDGIVVTAKRASLANDANHKVFSS